MAGNAGLLRGWLLLPVFLGTPVAAATAQTRYFSELGIGRTVRLGSVPSRYQNTQQKPNVYIYQGFRIRGPLLIAFHLSQASQTMEDVVPARLSPAYRFETRTIGIGPGLVLPVSPRLAVAAIVTESWIETYWYQAATCFVDCPGGINLPFQQTTHGFGTQASIGLTYLIGHNGIEHIPFGIGLGSYLVGAPKHPRSGLPLTQGGLYAFLFAGEP